MQFFFTSNEIEMLIDCTATRPFICSFIALTITAFIAVVVWGNQHVKKVAG